MAQAAEMAQPPQRKGRRSLLLLASAIQTAPQLLHPRQWEEAVRDGGGSSLGAVSRRWWPREAPMAWCACSTCGRPRTSGR